MKYTDKPMLFKSIKELPPQDRPRERISSVGPQELSDAELVCILLGSGGRERPVQDLAEDILDAISLAGGRQGAIDPAVLDPISGLGPAKKAIVMAALELGRRMAPQKRRFMSTPQDVFNAVRHLGDRDQEQFICVMLNGAKELLGINIVTVGIVNRTLVHPREVFSEPITRRATSIVLCHNHPSGNLTPSPDDMEVTQRLRKAGELLGIRVEDHIIFDLDDYHSMLESGDFW